jgi:hypothetical protein
MERHGYRTKNHKKDVNRNKKLHRRRWESTITHHCKRSAHRNYKASRETNVPRTKKYHTWRTQDHRASRKEINTKTKKNITKRGVYTAQTPKRHEKRYACNCKVIQKRYARNHKALLW